MALTNSAPREVCDTVDSSHRTNRPLSACCLHQFAPSEAILVAIAQRCARSACRPTECGHLRDAFQRPSRQRMCRGQSHGNDVDPQRGLRRYWQWRVLTRHLVPVFVCALFCKRQRRFEGRCCLSNFGRLNCIQHEVRKVSVHLANSGLSHTRWSSHQAHGRWHRGADELAVTLCLA